MSSPPLRVNLNKIPLWTIGENIDILEKHHFTHLCLNNNHSFDLFENGLNETIERLAKSDIKCFGLNYGRTSQFITIKRNDIRLGIFGVNWIQSHFNDHLFKRLEEIEISDLKRNVDFLICSLHWGDDHNIFINKEQQETARELIDKGVDLIIGHHPDVPQGHESFNGKYVFYSLGNFIFTPKESHDHLPYGIRYDDERENLLFQRLECKIGQDVKVVFKKRCHLEGVKPVYRNNTLPHPMPEHLFVAFYEDLEARMNTQVSQCQYDSNEAEKKWKK